jgi:hypothetical protein
LHHIIPLRLDRFALCVFPLLKLVNDGAQQDRLAGSGRAGKEEIFALDDAVEDLELGW